MMKKMLLASALTIAASAAQSVTLTYVGSWWVYDGPLISVQGFESTTTQTYTGQEVAALLFGGVASHYAISTVSDQVADINFSTWIQGWGDPVAYGPSGEIPPPQGFSFNPDGYGSHAAPFPSDTVYPAYAHDHFSDPMVAINYAFQITAPTSVPAPAALPLLAGSIGCCAILRRYKRKS